jgi:uncharacterized protein
MPQIVPKEGRFSHGAKKAGVLSFRAAGDTMLRHKVCGFLNCILFISIVSWAQESYESRAARLQPEDIPVLIQKAQGGDFGSQVLLWLAYSHGYAVQKDLKQAVPWLRKAAEHGCSECEWELSNLYANGRGGLPKDNAEAFKWALKAAERGHPVAEHNVGDFYFEGVGVEKNPEQARYWLTKAAEQGFAHSQWLLATLYLDGIGGPPDREQALKWLSKSLAQEHSPSMETLANMFTDANGVPQQPQLVFDLHRAAAQLGNHRSEFEVGRIYRSGYLGAPDYSQALVWFNRAAAAQYGPAYQYLGAMYETGQGTPINITAARSYYQRAASLGVSGAIQKIGELNRDGIGEQADPVAACMWFIVGSKMGIQESESDLKAFQPTLKQDQYQMALARANTWMTEHPDAMEQKPGHYSYQGWTWVNRDQPSTHPPSTQEERTYAILLTHRVENDPLSLEATAARAWLDEWWQDIPDIMVRPCNLVDAPDHAKYPYETELYKQITYSEGEYILENLSKATNWDAAFLAGVRGALHAYESILKQKPSAEYPYLDDLRQQRDSGRLPDTIRQLAQQRCKN